MEYQPAQILGEISRGDVFWLGPIALAMTLIGLFIVAWADTIVVRGCGADARYLDMVRGKAGSSILDVVGYAASHGGYAVWIARFARATAGEAFGILLFIMASDLLAVSLVATLPLVFGSSEAPEALRWIAPSVAMVLLFLQLMPDSWRGRGAHNAWRRPWSTVSKKRGLAQLLLRVTQILIWVFATWTATRAFGLPVPLSVMCLYAPIILLVASLPLNVAGFGVAQGAWLLLVGFAPAEQILAFALLWNVSLAMAVVLRGAPFIRRVVAEIAEGPINFVRPADRTAVKIMPAQPRYQLSKRTNP
jgi:hypothetical protein